MSHKESTSISSALHKKHTNGLPSVGIVFPGYGYERVSYALPIQSINYNRVYSIPVHRLEKNGNFYKNTPLVFGQGVKLLHTWNAIPITEHPFVVSFENEIPRYFGNISKWQKELGFFLLKSNRCKAMLALSNNAAKIAHKNLVELGLPEIASKIQTFRGGIMLNHRENISKHTNSDFAGDRALNITFVGADLFPKGFVPAFEALTNLVSSGAPINLTVIGRFKPGGYVLKEFSNDPVEWSGIIKKTPWLTHYESLPNKEVINQLLRSDLLIFPSYDESLGWAVIEAGLLGVPSITTNIFALPELVKHNVSGHVINLKLGNQNRWQGIWEDGTQLKQEIQDANQKISEGITSAVLQIIKNPQTLVNWGEESKKHLKSLYCPVQAARKLSKIYSNALEK
jgi:glycosyltransferase involved in cell wall biosynthesis